MKPVACVAFLAFVVACGGDGSTDTSTDDNTDDSGPIALAFAAPAADATVTISDLDEVGFLVAAVPVTLDVTGSPSRIVLTQAGRIVGEVGADGTGSVDLTGPAGATSLVAIAYDANDLPAASAEVALTVAEPELADCHAWLDLYGLTYVAGPASPGVDDPITVTTPINGLAWRYVENAEPRPELFGGCELIKSLAIAAPYLRRRDVVEVADIGVYNYRCIGGVGTPPNCPNGISQHAYANAIDLAGFTTSNGNYASVLTDWVIDDNAEQTCAAAAEPGADQFLHDVICELKGAGVWNIVLTPNYNADHRNHFHVDLSPGADTINRTAQVGDAAVSPDVAACAD